MFELYRRHDESDADYAARLYESSRKTLDQARQIADGSAADAAARVLREREGLPLVTISLDTPIEPMSVWSGDPDEEQPDPPRTIRDAIVEAAAAQLVGRAGQRDLERVIREQAEAMATSALRERVDAILTDALETPFRQTDAFGQPKGEETSIRAMIVKKAHEWLTAVGRRDDRNDRDGRHPNAASLVRSTVDEVMTRELTKEVQAAKDLVKNRVQVTTSAVLAKAVTDGLGLH